MSNNVEEGLIHISENFHSHTYSILGMRIDTTQQRNLLSIILKIQTNINNVRGGGKSCCHELQRDAG